MNCLLDTHTLLWALRSPERLSPRVHRLLEDQENSACISLATPWEMAIKQNQGKLDVASLLGGFEQTLSGNGYRLLELRAASIIRSGLLPFHHRDPFDRLLAAQALDLDIPILSRDPIFDRYGVRRIWT